MTAPAASLSWAGKVDWDVFGRTGSLQVIYRVRAIIRVYIAGMGVEHEG